MRPPKAASEWLAAIGAKGGKATGKRKARSPEQYKAMAEKSAEVRKAKMESKMKRKSVAVQIAEHFSFDVADIRETAYHEGWYSPKVYACDGNNYWSAGPRPPKYSRGDDGMTWVQVESNWKGNGPLWRGTSN